MLFVIRVDGSLGSRSRKTINYSSHHSNNNMKVLKKKVLKCLWVRKVIDIGLLRPSTLLHVIVEVVKVLDIGINRPYALPQVITEVVDVGQV